MMESLSEILSGPSVPDSKASASVAQSEPAKDVKSSDEKSDASATSAEQAKPDQSKAEGESKDKPEGADPSDAARDEKGRFAKPDVKDKSDKPDEVTSLKKALQAERKKRQELEKSKESPKDEKPKKDFWEDPEGAIKEHLSASEQAIRRETEARFFALCERQAKAKHDDYEAIVETLIEETDANPILAQQVFSQARESDDPAEFLYSYATHRKEMKAVGGDLGKYKSSIEAPHLSRIGELEKENKALKDKLEKLGKVPSSLNERPSATRASVELEATEEESLEEITKPRKRRA